MYSILVILICKREGVTSAKRALLYLLLRLGLRNVSTRIFNKQKFNLLLVLLKGAYFPRIAVSQKCFTSVYKIDIY